MKAPCSSQTTQTTTDGWTIISWTSPAIFALLLAAATFAAYPEVILGVRTFFIRDFSRFGYPLAFHHQESFWRGEIPLWNPLNNFGLPFLAQWNTLVLYPGSLFYLLLPLSWSLAVFCLLHQFLGGLGMYLLARRWTGSSLGAALAGMVFAFNGLTLNCLMWPNNIAALGWMPWVISCVERGWSKGGRAICSGAVVAAMQMLAGAPEIILFTWIILALLLAAQCVQNRVVARRVAFRFALLAVLVAGLSSIQLLPFLDLLAHSQRDSSYADSFWAMPPTGWANFIVPLCHFSPSARGVFFQPDQMWTTSYYLGVATLVLAVYAARQIGALRVRLLAALAFVGVILALGENGYLYKWLRPVVPVLGFVRFPIKFVALTVFCVPLLAAFTVQSFQARQRAQDPLDGRLFGPVLLGTVLLIALIVWLAYRYPFPRDDWVETWKNALFRAAFFMAAWCGLRATILTSGRLSGKLLEVTLVFTVWLDLVTHVPRQNLTIQRAAFQPGLVRISPPPGIGVSRVMVSPHSLVKFHFGAISNEFNDYLGTRLGLADNCNLLDGIPKADGFFSMYLREANKIIDSYYYFHSVGDLSRLMDFVNVSHVTAPGTLFDWDFRASFMPFVTAGQQPLFADGNQTFQSICSTNFNPRRVVFLPLEARPYVRAGPSAAEIRRSSFTAHRGEIEVMAPAESLVVISQGYYHPWRATVDGRPARIWRANYAFQTLAVQPGLHHIELIYRDPIFYSGTVLSLLTLLACLVGAISNVRPPDSARWMDLLKESK